ncbi:MAG: hypothetical protein WCF96_02725 [Eubacteriales bacterium]
MKILSSYKYQISDLRRSLAIFYGIILIIIVFAIIMDNGSAEIGGMEMASSIFIFVVGLNSFRQNFLFSLANGVSRKTQFIAFIASISTAACIMAIIDRIYSLVFSNFILYGSLFQQIYYRGGFNLTLNSAIMSFVWSVVFYISAAMFGYMICLIYYRSGRIMKLVVSILPPVLVFIALPYLAMLNTDLSLKVLKFAGQIFGVYPQSFPINAVFTFLIISLILSFFSFLLMRRAQIKQ